jgi:hypothetical protein
VPTRFRFALQPLLDERRRVEEAAQIASAQQERAYRAAHLERAATEEAIRACMPSLELSTSNERLRDSFAYAAFLQSKRSLEGIKLERAQAVQKATAQTFERALLAREQLEAMRRTAYEAFIETKRLADERELDEANQSIGKQRFP